MHEPEIKIAIRVLADGAFAIDTEYSQGLCREEALKLLKVFDEQAISRVRAELTSQFKPSA